MDAIRSVLSDLRNEIAQGNASSLALEASAIEQRVADHIARWLLPSLRPVINATGVILHTNLGRAPLAKEVTERIAATATQYSNLEYDIAKGARGKRDVHTAERLARLLDAEAAILVNNNAAAVLLVLNTFAKGGEVVVSRGELIEIGDGFRIPDIMAESGAILREVGTTNRTRLADYERGINRNTRLILRVHPSNFRIEGFTARPELKELVALGRRKRLPVFEDLGSGNVVDLASHGVSEPVAAASFRAGVSLISASGDKLLGGPQAGLIAGNRKLVERVRKNSLFRALRVDKLTIAAMEVTLSAYLRGALDEIPTLRMIRIPAQDIERRAHAFVAKIRAQLPPDAVEFKIVSGHSVIGGGSTPGQPLPTGLITVKCKSISAVELEKRLRLRADGLPVIARIETNRLVLDLRTVWPEQEDELFTAVESTARIESRS